jgi:hypothetical protein
MFACAIKKKPLDTRERMHCKAMKKQNAKGKKKEIQESRCSTEGVSKAVVTSLKTGYLRWRLHNHSKSLEKSAAHQPSPSASSRFSG